jgi:hypothetical protein
MRCARENQHNRETPRLGINVARLASADTPLGGVRKAVMVRRTVLKDWTRAWSPKPFIKYEEVTTLSISRVRSFRTSTTLLALVRSKCWK